MRANKVRFAPFALVLLVLSACSRADSAPLPEGPAQVTVTMRDNEFQFDRLPDRRAISFRMINRGSADHDLTLIRVPQNLPTSLNAQLRGPNRLFVLPIAEIKVRRPGESGIFAVDLPPGRYGVVCYVRDPDGIQHARKGMNAEFRVT